MHNQEALKKPIFKIISDCSENLNVSSYVVGGYVRDIILSGKKSNDIDIVAIGDGIELAKAVSSALPNKPKEERPCKYAWRWSEYLKRQGMKL